MLNRITLMGRLTRDPEVRYTTTNTIPVASFSVAVDRNIAKDKEKVTDFFDIVAWRERATFVEKWFKKGQLICVDGRLQRRQWEDKDGNTRYAYEIVAEGIHFAGANKGDNGQGDSQHVSNVEQDFDPFAEDAA